MNEIAGTAVVILLGALWAFWDNIAAWVRGQSSLEYVESQIAELKQEEQAAKVVSKPTWPNWIGLAMGATSLLIADPNSDHYVSLILIGIVALLINGVVLSDLLRKQKH